jgi:homoserine kinase
MKTRARVRVPATTANLGAGFDVLGLALSIHNEVTLEQIDPGPDRCAVTGPEARLVPTGPENLVLIAARRVFQLAGVDPGALHASVDQHVPVSSGMGSSSAALVGGAAAANLLLEQPLPSAAMVELLGALEGHAEQAAAALLGGLVSAVVDDDGVPIAIRQPVTEALRLAAVTPAVALETKRAREVLPQQVAFRDAVAQLGDVVALLSGLEHGDARLLRVGTRDRFHQDPRTALLPCAPEVLHAALDAGAGGACWSGAGPTMLAISTDDATSARAADAMATVFAAAGLRSTTRLCTVDHEGTVEV